MSHHSKAKRVKRDQTVETAAAILTYDGEPFTGELEDTDAQGQVIALTSYSGGVEHGPQAEWYPTGEKYVEGQCEQGSAVGEWREWHRNGELAQYSRFNKFGELIQLRRWDEQGNLVEDKRSGVARSQVRTGTAVHGIPRHEISVDFARDQADTLQRLIESALEDIETDPDALSAARRRALMRFEYLTALDPTAGEKETWQAAVFASQTANAAFARTSKAEDTVRCRLGDREYDLPVLGPSHHATPVDWLTAAFLAVITRSEERLAELSKVGEYTLRGSGAQVEDYVHPWIETLQRHLGGDQVPPALLESVIDLTDVKQAKFATPDFMLLVAYPPANILFRVLRGTAEQFNNALMQATTSHRDYWRQADFADNPDGFVAIAALAMAIRGKDNGFPVEVESGYLPENLVNGTWSNR